MKRIAFTIIYDGYHHLRHNNFAEEMIKNFDHWVIVEGAASNGGSTSWCKDYFRSPISTDGTREYLQKLSGKYPEKLIVVYGSPLKTWPGKDDMVNAAIEKIKELCSECYLWQVDADEQWRAEQLKKSESELERRKANTAMFLCDYFLSEDLYARGDWGEGIRLPYRRLWKWNGQSFKSHEPPVLEDGNGKEILLQERFQHYAYLFERDVHFKSRYYGGHENIYDPWLKLQIEKEKQKLKFPLPISYLFGNNSQISKTRTYICR